MANKVLTDQQLEIAKEKYLAYEPVKTIAFELGINTSTLQYHVNEKWREERQLMENEVIAEFGHTRAAKLNLLSKYSIDIIVKALENLKKRSKAPSMLEARAAATLFETLDKIMRLDRGSPTDIISETKPMTIIELKKEFETIDPFYEEAPNDELLIEESKKSD